MSDDNDLHWAEPEPRAWACYHAGPIDHAWHLLPTVDEVAQKLARNEDPECHRLVHFLDDFTGAKDLSRTKGWEGDFIQGPHAFFLPSDGENTFLYAFVWKQRNNGTTFIVSPVNLPWLGDLFAEPAATALPNEYAHQ